MSKALDYLVSVRGDAILPYFKFLKEAGKHLDVRSRDLISVITKVDSQTEKGLKQYLLRALRNGATGNEILDALLMAFPTLGLTKIIWAVNIIMEMDLPEFQPEQLGRKQDWQMVCSIDEIKEGEVAYRSVQARNIFIYREKDTFKVYDSRCPHRAENIQLEAAKNLELTCPRHQWKFDLKTGNCIDVGDKPLRTFNAKIENNNLFVFI